MTTRQGHRRQMPDPRLASDEFVRQDRGYNGRARERTLTFGPGGRKCGPVSRRDHDESQQVSIPGDALQPNTADGACTGRRRPFLIEESFMIRTIASGWAAALVVTLIAADLPAQEPRREGAIDFEGVIAAARAGGGHNGAGRASSAISTRSRAGLKRSRACSPCTRPATTSTPRSGPTSSIRRCSCRSRSPEAWRRPACRSAMTRWC